MDSIEHIVRVPGPGYTRLKLKIKVSQRYPGEFQLLGLFFVLLCTAVKSCIYHMSCYLIINLPIALTPFQLHLKYTITPDFDKFTHFFILPSRCHDSLVPAGYVLECASLPLSLKLSTAVSESLCLLTGPLKLHRKHMHVHHCHVRLTILVRFRSGSRP